MEKKLTRRESRETAFLTAFAATFEPEEPTVPAEEHAAPDAFANQLLAAMNDHAAELDEIITAHLKGWTLSRVPRVSLVALRLALAGGAVLLALAALWAWSRRTQRTGGAA